MAGKKKDKDAKPSPHGKEDPKDNKMNKNPLNVLGDATALAAKSIFSVAEVKRIQKRYSDLMNPSDNILMTKEVMQMPEFRGTPFMDRILHHITPGDKMNFTQFLYLVSVMSIKTPLEEKRKVLFTVYDGDNDGFISETDLMHVLPCIPAFQFLPNIEETIKFMLGGTDGWSIDEFQQFISDDEVQMYMSVVL